jgi:hypothetical protein
LAAELERQRRPGGSASSKRMVDIGSERGAHSNVRTRVGPILIQERATLLYCSSLRIRSPSRYFRQLLQESAFQMSVRFPAVSCMHRASASGCGFNR